MREAMPVYVRMLDGHLVGAMITGERQVSLIADANVCVATAAGVEADALYSRVSATLAYLRGGVGDYAAIRDSIAHWRQPDDVADQYTAAARNLLRRHWPRVVTVAEALHAAGELSAERVSALLGSWEETCFDADVAGLACALVERLP